MACSNAKPSVEDIEEGLGASLRLHREAALHKLECRLRNSTNRQSFLDDVCPFILQLLSSEVWQQRLGGFDAAKVMPQP
jgi:hypothetical protein